MKNLTHYPQQPKIIQIETTVVCNANCPFCPQKRVKRLPKFMEDSVFYRIVDQTRGMGILYRPFLLSEPFCDSRIIKFINYIKQDPTARVDIDSNGGLLTKEQAEKLADCDLEETRFSIDGLYDETYIPRRGLNRASVYRNVEYFASLVRKRQLKTKIVVRMIHIPGKEDEEEKYMNYWKERVDEVVITREYRYPWEGQTKPFLAPCPKIKQEMFFFVNGNAALCCWDAKERSRVGNVKNESVLDIWNGKLMSLHRKLLDAGRRDCIPLCSRCDAFSNYDFRKHGFEKPASDEDIKEWCEELKGFYT